MIENYFEAIGRIMRTDGFILTLGGLALAAPFAGFAYAYIAEEIVKPVIENIRGKTNKLELICN